MKASRRVLARYIADQLKNGKNRNSVIESLAAYVVEHRMKADIELIVADIARNLAEHGHIEATVTTAHPLDTSLKQAVVEYVTRIESASDVVVTERVDKALLGGVIIETPRRRYDASLSTKLKRLRNA
jgi:F-type H+-transporting ATPase subunit delta